MRMLNRVRKLAKLFFTMLYISAFTFGGGYVIVGLMRSKFVNEMNWLTEEEMLDITAIAQSSPGAIAVNAAIMVGWKIAGILGMVIAVLGTILPPLIILSVVSLLYGVFADNRYVAMVLGGMKVGVAALVINIACDMGITMIRQKCAYRILIMIMSFCLAYICKVNVILIISAALLLSVILAERNKLANRNDIS